MPTARTLDIACGTGWLTQHLPGRSSASTRARRCSRSPRERIPDAEFLVGDALDLPFEDGAFERITTGHFYGHLEEADRVRFLDEARRVARELVVIDSALHDDVERRVAGARPEGRLALGGLQALLRRRSGLAEELGGGEVLFDGNWFVVVRSHA